MLKKTYLVDETPGSISNIYEIKILICRILNEIKTKITKNQLNTALQLNETMNYFNFCQALKELLKSKHIIEIKNGKNEFLTLTNLGIDTANILTSNLPKNIVTKNIKIVKEFLEKELKNKNKKTYILKKDDGYIVKLRLEETNSNLFDLEFFCPTSKIAENVKKQMKEKTTEIYEATLAIIENDDKTLLKIASKLKNKFSNKE